MPKFMNKAGHEVEAWQFDGSIASVNELLAQPEAWWDRGCLRLKTPKGSVLVPVGDWVVHHPDGFFPQSPETFEAAYAPQLQAPE